MPIYRIDDNNILPLAPRRLRNRVCENGRIFKLF